MFEIIPILSALFRHKTRTLLIILQVAITLAVVVNSISIIQQRLTKINTESGLAEDELMSLNVSGYTKDYAEEQNIRADVEMLRRLPGVKNVVALNQIPLSGSGDGGSAASSQENHDNHINIGMGRFAGDSQTLDTLGVKLIEGRNFTEDEVEYTAVTPKVKIVIITKSLADKLFPDGDALGKNIYVGDTVQRIIGIIENMSGSWSWSDSFKENVIYPVVQVSRFKRILIRAEPAVIKELLGTVEKLLIDRNPQRVINGIHSMKELRQLSYSSDSAMTAILWAVIALLIVVTGLGIVGIVSFNVNQRVKQIGTRRALGASQWAIQRYFMTENILISSMGLALGLVFTVMFNIYLVNTFKLAPLQWHYIPVGMLLMLALGLMAVWFPAKRAAGISPAIATQSI